MMVQAKAFNIYFCLALAIGLVTGCKTTPEAEKKKKDKKLATVLRLHLEMRPDNSGGQQTISVIRGSPVQISVKKSDFLNEANVAEALVVDTLGGFSITLKFDRRGRLLLEQYTSANVGKRIAVYVQFGEGLTQSRWLAAPVIRKHVGDGVFTFTPDCSREEAEEIVKGLNNVAKKTQSKNEEW
jgi:preprotein translocase subunit SecD